MTDNSVTPSDRAAASFVVRCLLADPCRSSVKPKPLGRRLGWSPQHTGSVLAAIGRDPPADLALSRRPGGRGGARWAVRRRGFVEGGGASGE